MDDGQAPSCPFCPFMIPQDRDIYDLLQHVELCHPENGESPFIAQEHSFGAILLEEDEEGSRSSTDVPSDNGDEEEEAFVDCPAQCGEAITIAELSSHMEMHAAEGMALDGADTTMTEGRLPGLYNLNAPGVEDLPGTLLNATNLPDSTSAKKPRSQKRQKDHHGHKDWKELLLGSVSKKPRTIAAKAKATSVRRLGKAELGPHAHEEQMPMSLLRQLERGAKVTAINRIGHSGQIVRIENVANETRGIVPVLAQLCDQDPAISKAYLCHPDVKHVVKMAKEGGFCGYRNIQMLISFIQATAAPGFEHFPGRIPSILQLQDMIEAAWDNGINSSGRIETGGIKGTRKYIGTPEEAQALLLSLAIGCEASAFNAIDRNPIHENVLHAIAQYFSSGVSDLTQKVCRTPLPPIYFQHPGHSLTIVGLERRKSGALNLLVLDPMFKTSPGIARLIDSNFRSSAPEKLLKAYRRGGTYLQKYTSFEILKLTSRLPADLGWSV